MKVNGQLYALAALPPRKLTPVSIEQKAGWAPQGLSGRFGENKDILFWPGFETPIVQPVA